jgi:hypothetical protein
VAGFVDGEGCIFIQHRKPTRTHYLKLTVTNLNPAPLLVLQSLFGGSLRFKAGTTTKYRRLYKWEAAAHQAAEAIFALAPLLLVKRDEAEVAIAFQQGLADRPRGNTRTEEEWQRREDCARQLVALKAREYKLP